MRPLDFNAVQNTPDYELIVFFFIHSLSLCAFAFYFFVQFRFNNFQLAAISFDSGIVPSQMRKMIIGDNFSTKKSYVHFHFMVTVKYCAKNVRIAFILDLVFRNFLFAFFAM